MTDLTARLRHAIELFNSGNLTAAQSECSGILATAPDHPQALNLMATIAGAADDYESALKHLTHATAVAPEDIQMRFNLACCYQRSGDRLNAKRTFYDVVASAPEQLDSWIALGRMHQEDDEPDGCIDAFGRVIDCLKQGTVPKDKAMQAMANAYQGIALAEQKRNNLQDALAAYDAMASLNPDDDRAHAGRGWVLRDMAQYDDAIEAFLQASEIRPDRAPYLTNTAIIMMRLGDYQKARPLLERAMKLDPDNRQTLSALGVLLWETNEDDAYGDIFDYERYVHPLEDVPAPDGYQSQQAFHDALIAEIRNHPSLAGGRATNTTRNGVQTTNIMTSPGPAVSALRDIFNQAVTDYIQHPDHQGGLPGTKWQPHWRILGWGVVLSSQGHQAPHNHPTGMVSGVYYIRIPKEVDGSNEDGGFIEFGPPNEQYVTRREPPRHRVQPKEAKLCLFPSHYWHRTIPFESQTERICIAFDAIPAF